MISDHTKHSGLNSILPKNESVLSILGYFLEQFQIFSQGLSKICKIVLKYTLKYSQLILSSDNKKILLTTRNVRLDSGLNATKYYLDPNYASLENSRLLNITLVRKINKNDAKVTYGKMHLFQTL